MGKIDRKVQQQLQNMPDNMQFSTMDDSMRCTKTYYNGLKGQPDDIQMDSPAGVVFYNLQICFQNKSNICEGVIEDIIWSFRQSGIPNGVTWQGFRALFKLGYIRFTDARGTILLGGPNEKSWYQWTPKYYNLLLEDTGRKEAPLNIAESIKGKDTTVDKIE